MTIETISGRVTRVFFCNPDSPFSAGKFRRDDDGTEISFGGAIAAEVGQAYTLTGSWTHHTKYGLQFAVQGAMPIFKEDRASLIDFLAESPDFKGIGPARARKLVDAAAKINSDFVAALLADPKGLAEAAGIQPDVVEAIAETWAGRREEYEGLVVLTSWGLSHAKAASLLARHGTSIISSVSANPYCLIGLLSRFGFRSADEVARKMGVRSDDSRRLEAGLIYCMEKVTDGGNTLIDAGDFAALCETEMRPDSMRAKALIAEQIEIALDNETLVEVAANGVHGRLIGLRDTVEDEREVFEVLRARMAETREFDIREDLPGATLDALNAGQRAALEGALSRGASIITGGAGTGKTFTLRAALSQFSDAGLVVALCAPTGKAAQRIEDVTGREAKTIHRTLEAAFDEQHGRGFYFRLAEHDPIDADVVVVDEVSMVDVRLMRALLRAVAPKARLILLGDHHQIPSVGPGAILRDLIEKERNSGAVFVLTDVVRQAGHLATATNAILRGEVDRQVSPAWGILNTDRNNGTEPATMARETHAAIAESGMDLFGRETDPLLDIQILAPMRKGQAGTYALNAEMQCVRQRALGNPPPPPVEKDKPSRPLPGDRIVWTVNDPDLGVFNGSQGIITAKLGGGAWRILFDDGREIEVPSGRGSSFELAYAMTIHKSQGSEWPAVILIASSQHSFMHDRNLFYTGASRASKTLTIIGDDHGIRNFARAEKSAARLTFGSLVEPRFVVQPPRGSRPAMLPAPRAGTPPPPPAPPSSAPVPGLGEDWTADAF